MRLHLALLCLCVSTAAATTLTNPALERELLEMRERDQAILHDETMTSAQRRAIQDGHTVRIKEIARRQGWPRLSAVGGQAALGAWLLVQHADRDLAWQREALAAMEALLPENDVRKADIAYLRDRIAVNQDRPQTYGTQGRCVAAGKWEAKPMAEPELLDARRKAMDLPPHADYMARTNAMCKNYKPD